MSRAGRVRVTVVVSVTAFALLAATVYTQNGGQGARGAECRGARLCGARAQRRHT